MTILETIPIMEQAGKYNNLLLYSVIGTILCLFVGGLLFKECYDITGSIFVIFGIIGLIIMIISLILNITEPAIDTGRVKYVIRLNDNYSVNEFYDKYKVLEHTKYTDVYTVEELKND